MKNQVGSSTCAIVVGESRRGSYTTSLSTAAAAAAVSVIGVEY